MSSELTVEDYKAVFDAAPDGVLVVDRQGIIRDLNAQVERLFGYAREELLERPVEVLVPVPFREGHRAHRGRYVANPHSRPMGVGLDLEGRRKDGSRFPLEISLSPWRQSRDGDLRVICTVRDITDRQRLQNFSVGALRSAEEERRRIARELHDDTAQRLATLMLRMRLLAEAADAEERQRLAHEIRSEIRDTVESVKRTARGLLPPELEDLGLALALQAHFRYLREAVGFEVDAHIDEVDDVLTTDQKLVLYRIVQEAVSNVLHHSGCSQASVAVVDRGSQVEVRVDDEGRGFESGAAVDGSGLGLVGIQERAHMLGGRLTVDSRPGRGTTVQVVIPLTSRPNVHV